MSWSTPLVPLPGFFREPGSLPRAHYWGDHYLIFYNPYHHTIYEYASNDNIFGLSEFLGEATPAREGR